MKVDQAQLADISKRYGAFVQNLPLDGGKLLWALSGNESSFGQNVSSRHEPEYCPQLLWHSYTTSEAKTAYIRRPGRYANDPRQPDLHKEFGCLACCSLTPWQIMAVHAIGYTPLELLHDLERAAEATVSFLNRQIVILKPQSLADISRLWNGSGTTPEYILQLEKNYNAGLPG